MKDKILKEVLEWYESHENKSDVYIADFVELVINKTTEAIFEEVKKELEDEFSNGNLKHPFIISSDYYLDLKLKEIKNKCLRSTNNEFSNVENSETAEI